MSRSRGIWFAALTVLVVAAGGSAVLLSHELRITPGGAATSLAATADERTARAASRDFNRLAPTASPAPSPSVPGPTTARPSSPAASRSPSATEKTSSVPAGCTAYHGNQLIACTLLPSFGFSLSQMAPLINLWNGESGWTTTATNPSSGAYGIPQALPASKMASAGSDWRTNPATQIRWGLGYIKATYGTPAQAWATWQSRSPHWY